MKTEMRTMPGGLQIEVISMIQHDCKTEDGIWSCVEFNGWKSDGLFLYVEQGDAHQDGCSHKLQVSYCPFCGYKPTEKKK